MNHEVFSTLQHFDSKAQEARFYDSRLKPVSGTRIEQILEGLDTDIGSSVSEQLIADIAKSEDAKHALAFFERAITADNASVFQSTILRTFNPAARSEFKKEYYKPLFEHMLRNQGHFTLGLGIFTSLFKVSEIPGLSELLNAPVIKTNMELDRNFDAGNLDQRAENLLYLSGTQDELFIVDDGVMIGTTRQISAALALENRMTRHGGAIIAGNIYSHIEYNPPNPEYMRESKTRNKSSKNTVWGLARSLRASNISHASYTDDTLFDYFQTQADLLR